MDDFSDQLVLSRKMCNQPKKVGIIIKTHGGGGGHPKKQDQLKIVEKVNKKVRIQYTHTNSEEAPPPPQSSCSS